MRDLDQDAEEAYAATEERVRVLREEWERLARPVMAEGGATGRAPVVHPLHKALNEAEARAERARETLRKKHPGPRPSAVLGPLDRPRITRRTV